MWIKDQRMCSSHSQGNPKSQNSNQIKRKVITLFDWCHYMWDTSDNPNSPHTSITKEHAHSWSNVLLWEEIKGKGEPTNHANTLNKSRLTYRPLCKFKPNFCSTARAQNDTLFYFFVGSGRMTWGQPDSIMIDNLNVPRKRTLTHI